MTAVDWMDGIIALCQGLDSLLWVYVFIWAVILIRKIIA